MCSLNATAAILPARRSSWKNRSGKKRMKMVGNVEIPQEAFLAVLRIGEE